MALLKVIQQGDELIFDLSQKKEMANRISVMLVERAGRAAVLKISADRSIPIKHFRQARVPVEGGDANKI
jgi:hypothetical protein